MSQYIPDELALVRATVHEADKLVELLSDEAEDHSQTLARILSILEQQEAGVDLLIELRAKLEANGAYYAERAKAYKKYASSMANALAFTNDSILKLHEAGEIPNRLEGSAESLCIQTNPIRIECLVDTTNVEQMDYLVKEYPHIFKMAVNVTYSYDSAYVKANQNRPEVRKYFTFPQSKHIRVRRSTNPMALPKG